MTWSDVAMFLLGMVSLVFVQPTRLNVEAVDSALKSPTFWPKLRMTMELAEEAEYAGRWAEGCHCHESKLLEFAASQAHFWWSCFSSSLEHSGSTSLQSLHPGHTLPCLLLSFRRSYEWYTIDMDALEWCRGRLWMDWSQPLIAHGVAVVQLSLHLDVSWNG